jgi:hypothetical protein
MASRFDPKVRRERLQGTSSLPRLLLEQSLAETAELTALGSRSDAMLTSAIYCLLVGLDVPAQELLERTREWLDIAIATEEKPQDYFPHGTEASRYSDRALCHWLLTNEHDDETYRRLVEEQDADLGTGGGSSRETIDLVLKEYVDAGAYERAVAADAQAGPGAAPARRTRGGGGAPGIRGLPEPPRSRVYGRPDGPRPAGLSGEAGGPLVGPRALHYRGPLDEDPPLERGRGAARHGQGHGAAVLRLPARP